MTIREAVVAALTGNDLTDTALANAVNFPAPSVRRTRLALAREGVVEYKTDEWTGRVYAAVWGLAPVVTPTVEPASAFEQPASV